MKSTTIRTVTAAMVIGMMLLLTALPIGSAQGGVLVVPELRTVVQFYNDLTDTYETIPYMRQTLCDSGGGELYTAYADGNGMVSWGWIDAGNYKVKGTGVDSNAQTTSPQLNTGLSSTFGFSGTSRTTFTYQLPHTDNNHRWCVFKDIEVAKHWFINHGGQDYVQVITYLNQGASHWDFHFGGGSCWIHTGEPTDYTYGTPGITIHEYGHYLMYRGRGGNWPSVSPVADHQIDSEATPGPSYTNDEFAFTEGWANFFAWTVTNGINSNIGGDMEAGGYNGVKYADGPWGHSNSGDMDGWDVEGGVAAMLYDMYDSGNDNTQDWLQVPFSTIFDIAVVHAPNDMLACYDNGISHFTAEQDNYLYWICYLNLGARDWLNDS